MSALNKIVYLTKAQYTSLKGGTTIGGHTYDANNTIYITDENDADTVNGHTVNTDVPINALFTDHYHTSGDWDGMTYTATAVNGANALSFTLPVIATDKGGTGQTSLAASAKVLINALSVSSDDLTANDYIITQYVGGGTSNTNYYRRAASKVVNATLVKAALSVSSSGSATKYLNEKGSFVTISASDVGAAPSSTLSCTTANVKSALSISSSGSDTKYLNEKGSFVSIAASDIGLSNVTNHQQVHEVAWDGTNAKITRSKNGSAADVVKFVAGTNIAFDTTTTKQLSISSTDTKNTAGSTDSSSKLYLIGATSQAANPQTYSDAYVFATDGAFSAKTVGVNAESNANKVTLQWNSTDQALEFIFA